MTQFLIRLFIRQPDHAQDPKVRAAYGNLACWVGVACNLLLCLGKLTVGTLFGSIAIMADALNNLSDASSNGLSCQLSVSLGINVFNIQHDQICNGN